MKLATKIKIILIISLVIIVIGSILLSLALNTTTYNVKLEKPIQIIVYSKNEANNLVFEKNSEEYNTIYNLIIDSYKKNSFKAFFDGDINNSPKIKSHDNIEVEFNNFKIKFAYETPRVVKLKNKEYSYNGNSYWYQNFIFNITCSDNFQYNYVAIIPPSSSSYYEGAYNYSLQYEFYSNLTSTYNYIVTLFK